MGGRRRRPHGRTVVRRGSLRRPEAARGPGPAVVEGAEMSQTAGEQPPPAVATSADDEPADSPGPSRPASRLASVKATARSTVAQTQARVDGAREKVPAVDVAFTLQERDRRLAGNLLASALAYRLFLWLLPLL